jgi:hypothetical protein
VNYFSLSFFIHEIKTKKVMMNPILIKAFGVCTTESKQLNNKDYVFSEALKRGYLIIYPELINEDVIRFIESETVDYNSTFYKSWKQMKSKSRFEQFIDQVLHYATTYGTDFQSEFVYKCNDDDRSDVPDIKTYKVIGLATIKEVVERCIGMLTSGIAMSNDMVTTCVDYIVDHKAWIPSDFAVEDVQNREAMIQLCDRLGIHPRRGLEIVRWMVYKATGNALLIKDRKTIEAIKANSGVINFGIFDERDLTELSKVFFRFKPIFLAFKTSVWNKKIINDIRRMADKNHVPMREGFWQTVLGERKDLNEVYDRLGELTSFKIVSLLQTIRERFLLAKDGGKNAYFIRNGKAWVDNDGASVVLDEKYLNGVFGVLYAELVDRLRKKAGVVRFPSSIDLACPVSEKKFAGNLPYGSAYKMSNHNYFGIYWRESDGTRDFDLSFTDASGYKIGWNAAYRSGEEVLFSGDMTTARPEATEILYFKGGTRQEGVLWNNRFSGQEGSKFRYFMGRQEIDYLDKNYMVDPNTVEFEEWTTSERREEMMGVVMDNKIYPCKFGFGQSIVSRGFSSVDKFDMMKRKLHSVIDLKTLLLDAGFTEWKAEMTYVDENGETKQVVPDYDFTALDKDTLINLFTPVEE